MVDPQGSKRANWLTSLKLVGLHKESAMHNYLVNAPVATDKTRELHVMETKNCCFIFYGEEHLNLCLKIENTYK